MITDPIGTSQLERHPNCQRTARGSSYWYSARPAHERAGWGQSQMWASFGLRLAVTLRGEEVDAH